MTRLPGGPFVETTSSGSDVQTRLVKVVFVASALLFGPGTSSASTLPVDEGTREGIVTEGTTAGDTQVTAPEAIPSSAAVRELRARSGLTWEQTARLFGVSRRAAHLWASGKPMIPANEEHLHRCLAVLRGADRGRSAFTRAALFSADEQSQTTPYDLLSSQEYELAAQRLGPGHSPRLTPALSSVEFAKRHPPPPWVLAGALHGKVHSDLPESRAAKSLKALGDQET